MDLGQPKGIDKRGKIIFYPQTSDNKKLSEHKLKILGGIQMLPEELARIKIDKQLSDAGWDIVSRMEYIPNTTSAVKEALMKGSKESDYLLFVEDKATLALRKSEIRRILR